MLTRNENAWCSSRLREAFLKKNVNPVCFSFSGLVANVADKPYFARRNIDLLGELSAIVVRPIGRGSLDEIIFQMDLLHRISRTGLTVINYPKAIESGVDKYYTLALLEEAGVPVPRTAVTESVVEAIGSFKRLGGDCVVKPVFGSRGIGAARISDADVAERVFRTLRFYRHVIYIQEFIPHGTRDIRAFVVGDRVIATMFRTSSSWKTNVSRGARPMHMEATEDVDNLALKAAGAVGCEIAGVDIMESDRGLLVNEVNSQPGWRGLQSTSKIDIADEIATYVIGKAKR